jgi:hypothetical protein
MCLKKYTNSSGRQVLKYLAPDSIVLDLPFILTQGKTLTLNMPYMLQERTPKSIRLLDVRDADGIIYLNVQELPFGRTYDLSWNMEYDNGYWIWSLADFDTLVGLL